MSDRPKVVVVLEYTGRIPGEAVRPHLAKLLKDLGRWHFWKCVEIREEEPAAGVPRADGAGGVDE